MSTPNLGEIPNSKLRDAVHIPVVPVVAAFGLSPGQDVNVADGLAVPAELGEGVGIADPYRKGPIMEGQRFWLFMRSINGQPRHSWTSKDFPDEIAEARSEGYEEGMEEGQCCYGGG